MRRLLRRIFNIHPGEGVTVLILLSFIFFIQSVLSTGRVLQYSVFLDTYGQGALALAFLLSASILVVVSTGYAALTRLVRLKYLIPVTLVVLGGGFIAWRYLFALPPDYPLPDVWAPQPIVDPWGPFVLYIWVEVAAAIAIVQGWAFISDAFDPRQAKRLIPLVGLGASLSFLLNGFVIRPMVQHFIDAEDLTWFVAGSFGLAILFFTLARRRGIGREPASKKPAESRDTAQGGFVTAMGQGFGQIARTPLLKVFAAITVATLITQGLLDFIFLNEMRARFDKNELAAFYAIFVGLLGGMQILLQMFVSGRMLTLLGSTVCLMIAPFAVGAGAFAYVLIPTFWLMVGLRFGDRVLKQAFYSPSLQALYTPVPRVAKRQAMTLIKGVISPAAFALFSLILMGLVALDVPLRWVAVGVVAVTLVSGVILIFKARPAYVQALSRALERRKLDMDEVVEEFSVPLDGETIKFIQQAVFEEQDDNKAVFALRLVSGARGPQVRDLLFRACEHPSPRVRQEATALIAEDGRPADAARIAKHLAGESDPQVISQHLVTLAALGEEGAPGAVSDLLTDERFTVRAAANLCAIHLGLMEGNSEDQCRQLAEDADPAYRLELARAMQRFAYQSMAPSCGTLLHDESEDVRAAALRAAAAIRSDELLEPIMECFTTRGPSDEAGSALAALGDAAVPELGRIAADTDAPLSLRQRVPRILASVDTDRAGKVLESLLSDPSEEIRQSAIRSLTRITMDPGGYDRPPRELIEARIRDEAIHGHVLRSLRRGLSMSDDLEKTSLLYQELGHRYDHCLARIFGLAALVEDSKMTGIILWNLQSKDTRLHAHAIELIDTAFSREVAALVVPLVESGVSRAELTRSLPEAADRLSRAIQDPISEVVARADDWLKMCADVGWPERVQQLDEDLHRKVQTMLPLIEQILFLQSVPIFRELSGEELHFIAGITKEVGVVQGETLFHAGDPGDAMYLILDGQVSIQARGKEVARLGAKECFGEMAVLDNLPRSADVVAAEDTELLRIDAQSFDELLQEKYQIVKGIFKVLSSRLRQSTQRVTTGMAVVKEDS